MTRFNLSLLLFCFIFPTLASQSGALQVDSPCQIKELFDRRGWEIPGLSKTVTKIAHARYVNDSVDNVFTDILESTVPETSITVVSQVSATRLDISARPISVMQIQRFTMDDHVFGYLITAVIVGTDEKGHKIHAGSEERLYYYDPEGSGRFTVMQYAGEMGFKIVIPDWARKPKKGL